MADLIDRQAVVNAIENTDCGLPSDAWDELTDAIMSVPSVQPEQKAGRWIETKHDLYDYFICSECCAGFTDGFQFRYCPNCGAKMEEDDGN